MRGGSAGTRHALLLVLISCLPILGTLLIAPVLPEMARHFAGVPRVEFLVPFVQTAPAFVLALTGVLVGQFAGRVGRKRLLIGSMVLYAVAAPAPLFLNSLHAIIVSRLVVGLAEAGVMTTATTLIGDYFTGPRRDRYLGMQVLASSCSAVLFMTVGGFLGTFGWKVPFFAYLAPALLIPFAAIILWEPDRRAGYEFEDEHRPFPWARLLKVIGITLVAGMCMNLMSVEIGFVVDGLGERRTAIIGLVAALNSAGIVAGSLLFANSPRLAGSRFGLTGAIALAATGYFLLFAAGSTTVAAVAGITAGIGCGFYLPWLLAEANRDISFSQRGRVNGLWLSSYFLAVVAGPPIATLLAGYREGLQQAMLYFAVALAALALLAPLILGRNGRGKLA